MKPMGLNRRQCSVALLGGLGLGLGGLSGCARPPLRLGLHPWPGHETLTLAQQLGWLPEGVGLNWGESATDTLDGLRSGRLDAGCLTLDEVLLARSQGTPLTVVAVMDESVGADQVLARAASHPQGWRGARVAFQPSAVGHLVLHLWLAHLGLSLNDVRAVPMAPDQQVQPWADGLLDVAISYAPFSVALRRQGAQVVYDSSQFPGLMFDVLALHPARLGWRDEGHVAALVAAHFKGLEHLLSNSEDAMRRIAQVRGLSYAETVDSFAGLNLPRLGVNRAMLGDEGPIAQAATRLGAVMHPAGLLPALPDLTGLTTTRYLPRAL